MNGESLIVEKRANGVAVVTISNPPANTLNGQVQNETAALVKELNQDRTIRAVVFTSSHPKIFMAGADLGQMDDGGSADIAESCRKIQEVFNDLESLAKPTIAAIDGHALGGGCEFALACDFRIMGGGTIGLTEVTLGLLPAAGGTQRMTRLLGSAKATELIFLGKRLDAESAEQVGLVTKAVEPGHVLAEALKLADQLAEGAVGAMGLAKKSILAAEGRMEEGLRIERESFAETFNTGEPAEGLKAFFEKRKPQFNNQVAAN